MSEYQYYEFQAIDRPLTLEEQQAVASLSSRVYPHPRQAIFTYSFGGGLRRSPEDLLADYYDAMLYLANWGDRQLMFRFPKALVDLDQMQQYAVETFDTPSRAVTVSGVGDYAILDIQLHEEEGGGWVVGEGWLDSLIGLRDEILQRDYRLLYLAWLKGLTLEYDVDEDALEPPVPPGLGNLTAAQKSFVKLFEVDEYLIQIAAGQSEERVATLSDGALRQAIARLPREENDAFLLRLARGEPLLSVELNRKLQELAGVPQPKQCSRRTVGQLLAAAEQEQEAEQKRLAEEAEAKRVKELEALAQREEQVWQEVDNLIQRTLPKAYDEAVPLLSKLQELAVYQGRKEAFQVRLNQIYDQYSRRSGLLSRLRKAGLYQLPVE